MFRKWLLLKIQNPYNSFGNGCMRVALLGWRYIATARQQKVSAEVTTIILKELKLQAVAAAIWMAKEGY